jgi:hypothetical protein
MGYREVAKAAVILEPIMKMEVLHQKKTWGYRMNRRRQE